MTNGEKLKEVFPKGVHIGSGTWMSMEYEEPTTKIDLTDIRILPPVTPQESRWISVKDRPPKESEYGDVLVTFIPPAGALWATVMKAQYSDLMGIAKPCFHIGEVGKESFEDITPQVTAWMPSPQPYRGESEEENNV